MTKCNHSTQILSTPQLPIRFLCALVILSECLLLSTFHCFHLELIVSKSVLHILSYLNANIKSSQYLFCCYFKKLFNLIQLKIKMSSYCLYYIIQFYKETIIIRCSNTTSLISPTLIFHLAIYHGLLGQYILDTTHYF